MAYSMLVGPLKRANDSLSRSLGLFDTSRGFHYRERNYSNPGQREFQRLQIECHQLKQHMVRQSQIYADRVNCLEEVSNEVIRLQQYQIYRLSKKIQRRDLEIDELLEMLQNEEWKQLKICDKNVLAVNNVMVETDEQICDLRNQLQTALNDNHEKEVKMKDSTALLKTKIAQLETEVGLKDLKTKNLEKLLESTKTEIDSKNEELAKQDKQLAEQKHQLQQMFSKLHATEDTTMGVTITSLETKKKYIEEEIEKDQDKLLANEKTEIIQMNRRLQGTFASNGSDADGTIALLKKKIEHLEEEAGDHELQIKKLEELLASERLAISDKYEVVRQEMKEKDDHLQEMRVELQQTFKLMHEKESELDGIITSLRKDVTNLEKEVTQRDLKVKDLEVKRSKDMHKSDKNEQLTNKLLKEKDDLLSAQRNQLLHITKTFEEKEAEMNETITSLKKKIQNLEAESANGREVELKGMTKTLGHKNIESVNRKQQEKEMLVLKVKLQNTLTKLKDTETELDETRTRLSKAMGDRLTDNNPNIADLSDRNRPTKLAERYAELYDNQWTDAFDILVTYFHREGNAVEALLKILQDVMRFCQMKGQKQMESLQHVLEFSDKHDRRDLSADMRNILKVGRKAMASVAVGNLFQMYVSHLKGSTDKASRIALNVSSFTQECLEICWLMTIQDPSVVFAPLLRRGTRFNTDLFKPYTSSGTHVDYVVWPALLLHEGGPVLAKGVAQGYNKKENKSHNNKPKSGTSETLLFDILIRKGTYHKMADSEGAKDGLEEKAKEPQADSADVSENLRMKLTTMNNELQDTLKIVDSYKEDKRIAINTKNELDETKKKISVLQTRLSESESNCRRYRNERNNLRQDIAKLIQERKQMISYEEDVQQLKREIEMQKNRCDRNDREWKNKQTEMENRYDEIINEQKQKILSAEQEVQRLTKELEMQKNAHEQDKCILESKQKESEETSQGEDKQDNNEVEQNEDVLEGRNGKIKRSKLKGISETSKYGYIGKSDLNGSFDESNKHFSDDNNDGPKSEETNQGTGGQQKNKPEQIEEVIEKRDVDVKIITHENIIKDRKYDDTDGKEVTESFTDSTTQINDDNTGKPESEFVSEEPETAFEDSETIKRTKEKDKINDASTDTTNPCDTVLPKDLGLRYEQLYQTQWADAFENIRQHFNSEEETIEALLEILEDIMNFCKSKAREQIDDLYRVLTFSAEQEDGNVTDKITKHLKECMRELSCLGKEYLYGLYPLSLQKKSSRTLQYLMDIEDFVKESFELLWLMVIQDPPVVFCPIAEKGDVLDLDIYKSYKTTGRYSTFTVFPALLLHEDGPVLAMGVAEGDDQPKTRRKHDLRSRNTITPKDVDHKIKDEHDFRDRDHYFRRGERKYGDRHDFVSRNKTLIRDRYDHSLKNEHGFDDTDDFVSRKEMKNGERDFISRDHDKFRNKVKFVPEDEMSFHDRGNVVSRHDVRFSGKVSRGQTDIDDFILHEETYVSDRDDFAKRDIKGFSDRVEFASKDGGNYSDRGNVHMTSLYEKDSAEIHRSEYANWESYHRAKIAEEESPAYSQSIIKTKSRGTTNVWKPSYGYERDPTPDEMRLYFQYIDRHDHTGARDVLGHAAYLRCLRNDQKNHLYY